MSTRTKPPAGLDGDVRDGLIEAIGLCPVDDLTQRELWSVIRDSTALLTGLEMRMLHLRFGPRRLPLPKAALVAGVTLARAKCVEQRALYKLRKAIPYQDLRLIGQPEPSGWRVSWSGNLAKSS